jgi:CRP-like cAMP-binding protein
LAVIYCRVNITKIFLFVNGARGKTLDKKGFLFQNDISPLKEGLVMGEEAKDCGDRAAGDEGSEDGRDTLEDLTQGRPDVVAVLERPEIRKSPGDWIYQEGEEIRRFFYVLRGKVNIVAAGEIIGTVDSGGLLGVQEFLLRDETKNPKYSQSAQAVEPTLILGLDENGFDVLTDPQEGALKAYLRLQARVTRQLEEVVGKRSIEQGKLQTTIAQLRVALKVTQEDLVAKERLSNFPPRPAQAAPPPPHKNVAAAADQSDLLAKLRGERETNQSVVRLMERRDKELAAILDELRQIMAKHPELEKNGALRAFKERLEEAVTRRENTVVNLKPL